MDVLLIIALVVVVLRFGPQLLSGLGVSSAQTAANVFTSSATSVGKTAPGVSTTSQASDIAAVGTIAIESSQAIPVPGLSQAVGTLTKLVLAIFHGADPTQVASAQIQQVFDLCAWNIQYLAGFRAKMLPQQTALDALNAISTGCAQAELTAEQTGKVDLTVYSRSKQNIATDIQGFYATVSTHPAYEVAAITPVNVAVARMNYYTNTDMQNHGWYAWSIAQANQLTDSYVSALPQGVILT